MTQSFGRTIYGEGFAYLACGKREFDRGLADELWDKENGRYAEEGVTDVVE